MVKEITFSKFTHLVPLINWIEENRFRKERDKELTILVLHFDQTDFLEPYNIVPLACLIDEYKSNAIQVILGNPPTKSVLEFLKSFGFFDFLNDPFFYKSEATRTSTFGLSKVCEAVTNSHPQELVGYYKRNDFEGKSLTGLGNSLGELLNNIQDHSGSPNAFTFTQYFRGKSEIITCVCDLGIGIPKKVIAYLNKTESVNLGQVEAFKQAIVKHFSTKSTVRNKGLGLDNVLSNVLDLRGKVIICTNSVVYTLDNSNGKNEKIDTKNIDFSGTLVVIYINKANFPQQDEEDLDLDFED
ncbi:MAG: hypothetical protein LCH37_14825 [Bacteroidetes bacterium]|nr:hypothetical protein [Bacteroidota bacterium]